MYNQRVEPNAESFPILDFLLRAKRATYAASDDPAWAEAAAQPPSRPASHDLGYTEGDLFYLDTYLGGVNFGGQEAVWQAGQPVWAMNYYGATVEPIPEGFGAFLKDCLRRVPPEAPYRGPARHAGGPFVYTCRWDGTPRLFQGEEAIHAGGTIIYRLFFHGGEIR